jgi:ADP-ribose pyrophosphatase
MSWEYAQRVNATGAAIIVAVTDAQKLLLVEQYRIPCHAYHRVARRYGR